MNEVLSHPSRVRGLKSVKGYKKNCRGVGRTLHGCVDGNKELIDKLQDGDTSHPSRVRGLKLKKVKGQKGFKAKSHPSRVRGLKYVLQRIILSLTFSRTLHGCVDGN